MSEKIPPRPPNSFRITLELFRAEKRLDTVLLQAIKAQNENLNLRLTNLDISVNKIGDNGAKVFMDALKSPECKLTSRDISYKNSARVS